MNKMILILVLSIFLKPIFPLIDYCVNYDYISTALCENKQNVKLNCNGKCHLMKQLAKASENSSSSSDKKADYREFENLFCENIQAYFVFSITNWLNKATKPIYSNLYYFLGSKYSFHPPSVIIVI